MEETRRRIFNHAKNPACHISNPEEVEVAIKELHQLLVDAHAAHGAELGLGGIEQYSGGIPK